MLASCASQNFSMRAVSPETPAADDAAAIKNFEALSAATQGEAPKPVEQEDGQPVVPLTTADAPSMYTYDPWERVNRFTYRFNARFDEQVFLPVSNGYRRLPWIVRAGVHNFFSNLSEVKTVVNYGLQLQPKGGAHSLGRFVINSTVGIGGLLDVAAGVRLESEPTGFGSTLSRWGMHPGPYLVLPILGPSTLRESMGLLGDYGISYGVNVANLYRGNKTWALGVLNAVDARAHTAFRYYATGSPFEYETIRFLYVRKTLIEDEALRAKSRSKQSRDVSAPAGR
jgi:phospholipid-binding lipoprotein MlaA